MDKNKKNGKPNEKKWETNSKIGPDTSRRVCTGTALDKKK
jgi:hypothetical protein